MKPLLLSTIGTAAGQLRQGKSTREIASDPRISISSMFRIRNEEKENIPELQADRPRKISTRTG
jgi:hypothetical protein